VHGSCGSNFALPVLVFHWTLPIPNPSAFGEIRQFHHLLGSGHPGKVVSEMAIFHQLFRRLEPSRSLHVSNSM